MSNNVKELLEKATSYIGGMDEVEKIYKQCERDDGSTLVSTASRQYHIGRAKRLFHNMILANATKDELRYAVMYLLVSVNAMKKNLDLRRFCEKNNIGHYVRKYSSGLNAG